MNNRLKKCPFCGNGAKLLKEGVGYLAKCENCFARTSVFVDEYNALKHWNHREKVKIPKAEQFLYFGIRLNRMRNKRQISEKELAEQIGTSYSILRAVEKGETQPDCDMIVNCAKVLGCSTDYLLTGRERISTNEQVSR